MLFCLNHMRMEGTQAYSQKILLGVLLKEMWTFSYCSHSANHSPREVDELIFYGVCIAHIHESL